MDATVQRTLSLWRRSQFVWGSTDCIMATCNHVLDCTGIDPAGPWRGTYHDEAGAQAIYEAHGSILGLFRHGMALAGFNLGERAAGRPVVCDLGGHQVAGIDMGTKIMFMAEDRGVICLRAKVLGAWAI